jgi:hypothetical protein
MIAPAAGGIRDSLNRYVVGLGSSRGKHDLLRAHADKIGDLTPRVLHCRSRTSTGEVFGVGIANCVRLEEPDHASKHAGIGRRGGLIVQIHQIVLPSTSTGGTAGPDGAAGVSLGHSAAGSTGCATSPDPTTAFRPVVSPVLMSLMCKIGIPIVER